MLIRFAPGVRSKIRQRHKTPVKQTKPEGTDFQSIHVFVFLCILLLFSASFIYMKLFITVFDSERKPILKRICISQTRFLFLFSSVFCVVFLLRHTTTSKIKRTYLHFTRSDRCHFHRVLQFLPHEDHRNVSICDHGRDL